VDVTITVRRNDTKALLSDVEVGVFKSSDDSEIMNEVTVAGVATEVFAYPGTEVDIYWRVREVPATDPQFIPQSSEAQINENGFAHTVYLELAPYVDDVSS